MACKRHKWCCMHVLIDYVSKLVCVLFQDGTKTAVAVKTCKSDNDMSVSERFLEEACKYLSLFSVL